MMGALLLLPGQLSMLVSQVCDVFIVTVKWCYGQQMLPINTATLMHLFFPRILSVYNHNNVRISHVGHFAGNSCDEIILTIIRFPALIIHNTYG